MSAASEVRSRRADNGNCGECPGGKWTETDAAIKFLLLFLMVMNKANIWQLFSNTRSKLTRSDCGGVLRPLALLARSFVLHSGTPPLPRSRLTTLCHLSGRIGSCVLGELWHAIRFIHGKLGGAACRVVDGGLHMYILAGNNYSLWYWVYLNYRDGGLPSG